MMLSEQGTAERKDDERAPRHARAEDMYGAARRDGELGARAARGGATGRRAARQLDGERRGRVDRTSQPAVGAGRRRQRERDGDDVARPLPAHVQSRGGGVVGGWLDGEKQPRGRHKVQRGRSADAAKEDDQLVALAPAQGAVGAAKDEGAVANAGTAAARRQDGGIDIEHHRF